jgi:transcriptional regulator of aroF, aroG, tyrA and aromatic amino acid transport
MKIYNYRITTVDKVGVTLSILSDFYTIKINILQLELISSAIYIQFYVNNYLQIQEIHKKLDKNKHIIEYFPIDFLPNERKNIEVIEILDQIDEGIIISDENFQILHKNKKFEKEGVFNEKSLKNVFRTSLIFKELQKNSKVLGQEVNLKNGKKFLCSVNPYTSSLSKKTQFIWIFSDHNKLRQKIASGISGEMNALDDIIYKSTQMRDLIELAKLASDTDSNILIRGESGTGKELFARGIHNHGKRKSGQFIAINCTAIPDSLLESELFGYEEGSFTGSKRKGKIGLFEQANGGTFFLDEIGDLPLHLQAKLLRTLEQKSVRRIGSQKEVKLDLQIITATHQPLEELIHNQQFRLDLFYRLNAYTIQIPPLRFRKDDLKILVDFFLGRANLRNNSSKKISKEALHSLLLYDFPGNVRELENIIERSAVLSKSDEIIPSDLQLHKNSVLEKQTNFELKNYKTMHEDFERNLFLKVKELSLSTRELAKILEISHTSVANKLRKYTD